jgi:hypothetical protein
LNGSLAVATRPDGSLITVPSSTHATVIQAAIDVVAATAASVGGGTVLIRAGVYSIATQLAHKSGVVLLGEGHSGRPDQPVYNSLGTILKSAAALASVIDAPFNVASYATECVGAAIRGITIDGNSGQATNGITSAARDFSLVDVTILNCGTGWHAQDTGQGVAQRANHVNVWNCSVGIDVDGGATDGSIVDARILGNSSRGIRIAAGGWLISACHLTNGGTGSEVDLEATASSPNIIVDGNYFDTCGAQNILISGNQHMIVGNYIKAGSGNTVEMIKVTASGGKGTIMGNFFNPGNNTVNWVKYSNAGTPAGRVCVGNSGTVPTGALIANSAGSELENTDDATQYIKGNRGF